MKTKSFLIIFLLSFFLPIQIFASTNSYQEYTSQIPWSYEVYQTSDQYLTITSKNNQGDTGSYNTGKIFYNIVPNSYGRFFRYPTDTQDYILKKGGVNLGFTYNCNQYSKYCGISSEFTKYTTAELSNQKCQITYFHFNDSKVKILSNLLPLKAGSNYVLYNGKQIHTNSDNPIEHLLKKYYYMKTEIKAELINEKDDVVYEKIFGSGDYNGQKYVLVKPDLNTIDNLNLPDEKSLNLDAGVYFWKITATPIDLKCDFDKSGILEDDERTSLKVYLEKFTINPCEIIEQPTADKKNSLYDVGGSHVEIEYKIGDFKKTIDYKIGKNEVLDESLILSLFPDDVFLKKNEKGNQNLKYTIKVVGCEDSKSKDLDYNFLDLNLDLGFVVGDKSKRFLQDKSIEKAKVQIDDDMNLYLENDVLNLPNLKPMFVNGEAVEFKKEEVALIAHNFEDLSENGEEKLNSAIERLNSKTINQTITHEGGKTKYIINIENVSGFSEEVVYIYFPKSLANSTDDISLVNDELLVFDKDPILTNTIEKVPGVDWIDFIFFLNGDDDETQPLSVYITQGKKNLKQQLFLFYKFLNAFLSSLLNQSFAKTSSVNFKKSGFSSFGMVIIFVIYFKLLLIL